MIIFFIRGDDLKSTEVYYKDLKNLIPYKIDNVRIQYLPLRNRTDMQQVLILKLMVNLLTVLKVGQAYQ